MKQPATWIEWRNLSRQTYSEMGYTAAWYIECRMLHQDSAVPMRDMVMLARRLDRIRKRARSHQTAEDPHWFDHVMKCIYGTGYPHDSTNYNP